MQTRLVLTMTIAMSWFAAAARGHDFWIEPAKFRTAVGEGVEIGLRVGMDFAGEVVIRKAEKIKRFFVVSPTGEVDIPGEEGRAVAGVVTPDQPGLHIVGYQGTRSRIELDATKFEEYLREEGMDHIIELRRQRGQSQHPAREVYSRCAKALITADQPGEGVDRALGFTLELIPKRNPYFLRPGDVLETQLLFRDKPLDGILIVAINRDAPDVRTSARSNADGRVSLPLAKPGVWMIKCVYMVDAPPDADAEWESFWASLTFELPPTAPTGQP
ncbi:MAG: DUF4198 domain-containing protein [Phycisphaerales bacterium]|nr:DUF4198 domain-containing protein [Phycisphaerales bacterium]